VKHGVAVPGAAGFLGIESRSRLTGDTVRKRKAWGNVKKVKILGNVQNV